MRKIIVLLMLLIAMVMFTGCRRASDVASYNVSKDADQFRVYRRVVFYNGITDSYILMVEGFCSIETLNGELSLMVKTDDGKYLKHFLGLSDNVTYFAEQLDPSTVDTKHYSVVFKPSIIIPFVELD